MTSVYRPRYTNEPYRRLRRTAATLSKVAANTLSVTWGLASTDLTGSIGDTPLDAPSGFPSMVWSVDLTPGQAVVDWSPTTATFAQGDDPSLSDAAGFNVMSWSLDTLSPTQEIIMVLAITNYSGNLIGAVGLTDNAGFGAAVWQVRTGRAGRGARRLRIGVGIGL